MKRRNYNYIFLMYDVEEIRCQKIFKICKKYLNHYQNSVFRGEVSPSKMIKLKAELKKIMDPKYDRIDIIKFMNDATFEEENLGKLIENGESLFL